MQQCLRRASTYTMLMLEIVASSVGGGARKGALQLLCPTLGLLPQCLAHQLIYLPVLHFSTLVRLAGCLLHHRQCLAAGAELSVSETGALVAYCQACLWQPTAKWRAPAADQAANRG